MSYSILKALKTYFLNQGFFSDGLTQPHHFLAKSEQSWLFHMRDFCISCFSHGLEVGGAQVEKGDVTYFHAPIRV